MKAPNTESMYVCCNKLGCKIGVKSFSIPLNLFIQATLLKLAAVYLRKDYTSKRIYRANSYGYPSINKN